MTPEAISILAEQILDLINSRPQSPTKMEIEDVVRAASKLRATDEAAAFFKPYLAPIAGLGNQAAFSGGTNTLGNPSLQGQTGLSRDQIIRNALKRLGYNT